MIRLYPKHGLILHKRGRPYVYSPTKLRCFIVRIWIKIGIKSGLLYDYLAMDYLSVKVEGVKGLWINSNILDRWSFDIRHS